ELAADVRCSQLTVGLLTVHAEQLLPPTVTITAPAPPSPGISCDVLLNLYEQVDVPASCSTVTAVPATVSVVLRAAPVFAAIEYPTAPCPVPDAGLSETQLAPEGAVAVHVHPVFVKMMIVPDDAAAVT